MEKIKEALGVLCVISLLCMMASFTIGIICAIWNIDFILSEINLTLTFLTTTIFFGVILLMFYDTYE